MTPIGMTEEEYAAILHRYIDRLDANLRANEFMDAERALRDLVTEVLSHRMRFERHVMQEIHQATAHMMLFESKMHALLEGKE